VARRSIENWCLPDIQPASCDLRALERRLCEKVDDWRGLLRRNVCSGREVLRLVLDGPIKFTPVVEERRRGYAFEGRLALDRMLAGLVPLPLLVASPAGIETLCNVEREWIVPAA